MAATPQSGTMMFVGLRTAKTYSKDVYLSDVMGALINFDAGNGAGSTSPTSWTPPEPVALVDYAQVTGTADTTKLQPISGGRPTEDMLRYTIHLTTLNNRPRLRLVFPAMYPVQFLQR